ncbi:MAG TPA: energy transducer TonB [Candidatus Acidoferrales bacterium]|jgi:TonB family protein|nr:energy transducer TonB [Candidatus Acidoferrales bacterium]
MARIRTRAVFNESLLPEAQPRWDLFSAGFGLQCLAVAALVIIPMLMPQKLEVVRRYWTMPIEAPPVVAWKPQPVQPVKPIPIKREIAKVVEPPKPVVVPVEIPKPKIYTPVATAPLAKPATARKNTPTPDVPIVAKAFPDQNPPTSMGSSAIPTIRKPREDVQTGGFGDPDGVAANGKTNHAANIAVKGSFDLPPGPGTGNGTGGAKGAKGVIASTGFGNGVAVGGPGGPNHGAVQQGAFADEHAVAAGPRVKQTAAVSNTTPLHILSKPTPAYTDEGRTKKIEGDVLLEVVFTASGEVKVQRVVQGLGYGLDDSAKSAARQIRFTPAQQNGQPVDSTAIVHIVFALAN